MKTIKQLLILYFAVWAVPFLLAGLYFLGLFDQEGFLAQEATSVYLLSFIAIVLSLGVIYLAVKFFNFRFFKRQIKMEDKDWRLKAYIGLNIFRYALLLGVILFDLYAYYATTNNAGFYCAVITLLAASFCFPTEQEIEHANASDNKGTAQKDSANPQK